MKRLTSIGLLALAVIVVASSDVHAQNNPTRLDYTCEDIGSGLFEYNFELTLDNNDGSWAAGQEFGWLVFGDMESSTSLINDFSMTSAFPGPWTSLTTSGGFHNGPTFNSVLDHWIPSAVGESLVWSGTSATDLDEPDMLYSFLRNGGGSDRVEFAVANRSAIPEPSSMMVIAIGFAACLSRRTRKT